MDNFSAYLANSRKAVVNVLTVVLSLLTYIVGNKILPDKYTPFATSAVAGIGFVLHYIVANAPAPGTVPAVEGDISDEYSDDEVLDPGPVVDEIPVVPSVGKHEAVEDDSPAVSEPVG